MTKRILSMDMPDNYFSDVTADMANYRDILLTVEFGVIDLDAGERSSLTSRQHVSLRRRRSIFVLNFSLATIRRIHTARQRRYLALMIFRLR